MELSTMTTASMTVQKNAQGGIITIGNFDGVHRGHKAMLSEVVAYANTQSIPAVAVTFDPHPIRILKPEVKLPRLTSISTRTELMKGLGVDEVVVLSVTVELLSMSPSQFFGDIVLGQLQAKGICEGPDFRFGKDRAGDTTFLRSACEEHGLWFRSFLAVQQDGTMISSTRIRELLSNGAVRDANSLLGQPHRNSGQVIEGSKRGRELGFPTANIGGITELVPATGVYAARTTIDGKSYPVAVNVGANPTFDDEAFKVECHVLGFGEDLYGQSFTFEYLERLRGTKKFDSVESLKAQVQQDIDACRITVERRFAH